MDIRPFYVPKDKVSYVLNTDTIEDVLRVLKETGYRCIPVLSEKNEYVGMVYKVHIYEYLIDQKDKTKPVESLAKDGDMYLYEDDSFYRSLITIRRLPFLAILDKNQKFKGILTHSKVMDILEDSLGVKAGSYSFTITMFEHKGAIEKLASIVKKYSNIEGLLTLDDGNRFLRRIVLTIGKINEADKEKLINAIQSSNFRITHIDKIEK